jgi:hypothetical protein
MGAAYGFMCVVVTPYFLNSTSCVTCHEGVVMRVVRSKEWWMEKIQMAEGETVVSGGAVQADDMMMKRFDPSDAQPLAGGMEFRCWRCGVRVVASPAERCGACRAEMVQNLRNDPAFRDEP